jgi:hypothetical protein
VGGLTRQVVVSLVGNLVYVAVVIADLIGNRKALDSKGLLIAALGFLPAQE